MIKYTIHIKDKGLFVQLDGDLDIDSTEVFEDELLPLFKRYQEVFMNFENVPFVDSSGIGLLITLIHSLNENDIKIRIASVRKEVMNVFDLLQLPDIVGNDIFESLIGNMSG